MLLIATKLNPTILSLSQHLFTSSVEIWWWSPSLFISHCIKHKCFTHLFSWGNVWLLFFYYYKPRRGCVNRKHPQSVQPARSPCLGTCSWRICSSDFCLVACEVRVRQRVMGACACRVWTQRATARWAQFSPSSSLIMALHLVAFKVSIKTPKLTIALHP